MDFECNLLEIVFIWIKSYIHGRNMILSILYNLKYDFVLCILNCYRLKLLGEVGQRAWYACNEISKLTARIER